MGRTVRLSAHQVQTVALALHELVTNAVKYGALNAPDRPTLRHLGNVARLARRISASR